MTNKTWKNSRKFDGKRYKLEYGSRRKAEANSIAKKVRKDGYSVRIIKGKGQSKGNFYRIYTRRK